MFISSQLPKTYADFLFKETLRILRLNDHITWALSGGNTPRKIFAILKTEYGDQLPWEKIHIYWGDERCVPPDHEDSNYFNAYRELLCLVDIPRENIHRMKGECDPVKEAERYAGVLDASIKKINGIPAFDIILLGIGTDGHTASIFPGQKHIFDSEKNCEATVHPETVQQRITLTGRVINNADQVHFIASGSAKADVIGEITSGHSDYPAALVNPRGKTSWFLDPEAGSKLEI